MKLVAHCEYYFDGKSETEIFDTDFDRNKKLTSSAIIRILLDLECLDAIYPDDLEIFEQGLELMSLIDIIESRLGEGYVEITQ